MAFIPFANPTKASATIAPAQWQNDSIAPYQNNAAGYNAAAKTGGAYSLAASNYAPQNGDVLGASTNVSYAQQQADAATAAQNKAQAASDAAAKNAALFQIDQGIGSANDAMGRLGNQENTGINNLNSQYQDAYNRLLGQQKVAEGDYNNNTTDQLNQYQSARNQAATQGRSFLDGARRTLGSQGAGGGSAARFGVPLQAQQMVESGNAQAQSTNNHNISALTSAWNKAKDDFTNSQNDLTRQRDQGTNDFKSKIEQQRADLLSTIASLTGQRTLANGGNYQQALAASNPYTSKIAGILNTIDGLAATPAIHEQAVTVGRPDLSGYNFSRAATPTAAVQDPTLQGNNVAPIIDPFAQNQDQQNPILALFGGQQQDPTQAQFA